MNNQSIESDSTYDHLLFLGKQFYEIILRQSCLFVAKRMFPDSSSLIYFLHLLRVPMKNTFDTFFCNWIENKMDEVLNDEENIISVIHALRGW